MERFSGIGWYRNLAKGLGVRGAMRVWWRHHGIGSKRWLRGFWEMTQQEEDAWQDVGEVPVDTGRIMLADPCHLDALATEEETYVAAVVSGRINLNEEIVQGVGDTRQVAVDGDAGTFGAIPVGVEVRTGFGDGLYPVEVRMEDGYVAEVRVRFL